MMLPNRTFFPNPDVWPFSVVKRRTCCVITVVHMYPQRRVSHVAVRKFCATFSSVSKYPVLDAVIRTVDGTKHSNRLRKDGIIPGIVYGLDENRKNVFVKIQVERKVLMKMMRQHGASFENTIFTIRLDDNSEHVVTARGTQFHPATDWPLSINFLKYWPGNRLHIPFSYINEDNSTDLRRGSLIVHVNSFVECVCDGDVPATIVVDAGDLKNDDKVRLSDLQFPPGVRPSKNVKKDFVASVVQSSSLL